MREAAIILAAAVLLASCDRKPEREAGIDNAAIGDRDMTTEPKNLSKAPDADRPIPIGNTDEKVEPAVASGMPVAFPGRWAMAPADCGPDHAIAKGLMTIDDQQLRFYESVAKPTDVAYPSQTRMEGRFTFSGEGMDWTKTMTLTVDGDTLTRTEKSPDASYRYTRCAR